MPNNLIIKSLGKVEISSGDGLPDHVAPIGSVYTDTTTGKGYVNTTGRVAGWQKIIKDVDAYLSLTNNTITSITATNSWTRVYGNGVLTGSVDVFTYSPPDSLISSSGDGGFSNTITTGVQGFADNGWIVLNGTQSNKWYVGTTGASGGSGFGAYISNNNGASNTYSNGSASVVWFYRDVVLPAYSGTTTLSFSIRVTGESTFDYVRVYQLPTTQGLTSGVILAATTSGYLAEYSVLTGYPTQTLTFTPTLLSTTQSRRIAFAWRNDGSVGTQPPASIDNISLSTTTPLILTYNGSQSLFRSVMSGSYQATSAITSAGVLIAKNDNTTLNYSESSYDIGANRKDNFTVQNIFTMSSGDTITPFINNKVSNVSILVNDLELAIWEISI